MPSLLISCLFSTDDTPRGTGSNKDHSSKDRDQALNLISTIQEFPSHGSCLGKKSNYWNRYSYILWIVIFTRTRSKIYVILLLKILKQMIWFILKLFNKKIINVIGRTLHLQAAVYRQLPIGVALYPGWITRKREICIYFRVRLS